LNISARSWSDCPGMTLPAGVSTFRTLAAAVTLLAPLATDAASREERLQVIKTGRRAYDPLPPKTPPAPPVQTDEQRRAEAWRRAEQAANEAPLTKPPRAPGDEIYDLPKVTVRPTTKPIKRLPRTEPHAPPRKDLKAEPWETAAGRDARLVQRHLSKIEQKLIPLLGGSAVGTASGIEAQKQRAAEMDELASSLEIQEAAGRDPEEIKKLRAEYKRLHYSGPR
jgi:hypothetical protein